MKKYIFVTPEGLTYKPNYDSPEPDYLDIQIYGINQESTVQDAIQDLMELNVKAKEGPINTPFTTRIENNHKKSFWVKEKKNKSCLAS
jgi:hypothetical protein